MDSTKPCRCGKCNYCLAPIEVDDYESGDCTDDCTDDDNSDCESSEFDSCDISDKEDGHYYYDKHW